ncbi:uncharacterized protein LOC110462812 [Mizuhopecten yessoensis]|uniref:uncharacterized protein LOC110462812 n=1 Tax=Mizuhopecten yessoensis TaxID=6573 RepID=UPI000B457CA4|nr:uncharacterized protein LOC110462812 [Mizuhopecten yessoensis]
MSDEGQAISVLDEVPVESHPCKKITVDVMNKVLNKSEYIGDCDRHRNLVVGVRHHIAQERKWVLKNCKLTIALDNPNGAVNDRVKCIVVRAGKCDNEIHCARKPNGTICVMYTKTCMRLKVLNGIKEGINIFKGALTIAFERVSHEAMVGFRNHRMLEQNRGRQGDNAQSIEVMY